MTSMLTSLNNNFKLTSANKEKLTGDLD